MANFIGPPVLQPYAPDPRFLGPPVLQPFTPTSPFGGGAASNLGLTRFPLKLAGRRRVARYGPRKRRAAMLALAQYGHHPDQFGRL